MSKYQLQDEALKASGVSEKALQLQPSLFQRIGEDGFHTLSTLFYDRVFDDKEAPFFLNIFSSSTKREAIENQVCSETDAVASCNKNGIVGIIQLVDPYDFFRL